MIYFRIDSLMLYLMKGSHEAGLYSASYKVLEVLLAFPSLFGASVFALMSAYFKESLRKVENLFRRAFEVNVIFVLPIALGVLVVAVPIILLVSGSQFLPSASALKILAFALIGSYLNSVMIYTLLAAGRQKIMVAPYLLATFFNVVTNFIFIPRFGFIGASLTTVATEFLVLSYTWFLVQRELHFRLEWRIPLKALLSSLFMLILLLSLPKLSLLEAILVGGGVYFALLWGMRGLDPRWLRLIFNR